MIDSGQQPHLKFDRIAACARDLMALGPDTESEFLEIGRVLNTLATICFGMTDSAIKLSKLAKFNADGKEADNDFFIAENRKIFAAVTDHVKTTISSLGDGDYVLVELLEQMKKLRDPIRELQSTGKTFRVLGVGIKVESSRAGKECKVSLSSPRRSRKSQSWSRIIADTASKKPTWLNMVFRPHGRF